MSVERLAVYLDGMLAGELVREPRGVISFEYDELYRARARATPLSTSMPLTARRHGDAHVAPFLWGLLPDNERVLERWAREYRVSARRALDLLVNVGRDLPGAVQMLEPGESVSGDDGIEWLTDADVAAQLRVLRDDETAWHPQFAHGHWSLAGGHAKFALLFQDGRWGRPYGASATNRILKPALSEMPDLDLNEHLCLTVARRCGLNAAVTSIGEFEDERAIVVHRYDRYINERDVVRRLHQEDLCQALSVHPEHKYEDQGGPSARGVADLLRQQVGGAYGVDAVWQFFDALVFNWAIGAPDAHAKNYSLLLHGAQVRLAPIYDVASALPYVDDFNAPKVKLAMKMGGHYLLRGVTTSNWESQATLMGLDPDVALTRARSLVELLGPAFSSTLADFERNLVQNASANRLVEVVNERVTTLLARW